MPPTNEPYFGDVCDVPDVFDQTEEQQETPYHQNSSRADNNNRPAQTVTRMTADLRVNNNNAAVALPPPALPPSEKNRFLQLSSQGMMLDGDPKMRVKQVVDEKTRRDKYEVTTGAFLSRRGSILDSWDVVGRYTRNHKAGMLHAVDGSGIPKPFGDWLTKAGMIWVCVKAPNGRRVFYSHIGKTSWSLNRFHHSTFTAGGKLDAQKNAPASRVVAAGSWVVSKGQILLITAMSGHYRPNLNSLRMAITALGRDHHPKAQVLVYDGSKDALKYKTLSLSEFMTKQNYYHRPCRM